MNNIPDIHKKEWRELVTGQLNVFLKNFFFQMKVTQTIKLVKTGKLSVDEAIQDMYNLCVKFSKAKNMAEDLKAIFGDNDSVKDEKQQISNTASNNKNVLSVEKYSNKNVLSVEKYSNNNDLQIELKKPSTIIKKPSTIIKKPSTIIKKPSTITNKIERIKKEAVEREIAFKRKREELENKLSKEKVLREENERRTILEKRKLQEKKAIKKATKKRAQGLKKEKIKKKTFFQSFFGF